MGKIIINNTYSIGTNFNKDNIFLGTIKNDSEKIISNEEFDIFYKDENGYTRFTDKPEIFKGDNSDKKGIITNIVPVFAYYKEDELKEIDTLNGLLIAVTAQEPLKAYNEDYNLKNKETGCIKFLNPFKK